MYSRVSQGAPRSVINDVSLGDHTANLNRECGTRVTKCDLPTFNTLLSLTNDFADISR